MKRVRVTKEFTLEMAHALSGYDGKCFNLHGHTYHLAVTVLGCPGSDPSAPEGMVMDFGNLKRIVSDHIVEPFDHVLVLNENDERRPVLQGISSKVIVLPFQPTSENLLLEFVRRIKAVLPGTVELVAVRLRETATSYADWYASDNTGG